MGHYYFEHSVRKDFDEFERRLRYEKDHLNHQETLHFHLPLATHSAKRGHLSMMRDRDHLIADVQV